MIVTSFEFSDMNVVFANEKTMKAESDEKIVFSFTELPSREVCDTAHAKMVKDERMKPPQGMDLPFDGKRMIYAGFNRVVTLEK